MKVLILDILIKNGDILKNEIEIEKERGGERDTIDKIVFYYLFQTLKHFHSKNSACGHF